MHKLVDDLLLEADQNEVPIDLHVVASFRGVVEIQVEHMTIAAMLVPIPQGLRILVNMDDLKVRQRFSIAHEICHTLFPEYERNPVSKSDMLTGNFPIHQEEECLCDIGASRLLFPPALLLPRMRSYPSCLDSISQLAEDFQSSLESAAIAWTKVSPTRCAVVFFEETLKPSQLKKKDQLILPGLESDFALNPELRISLACPSASFPYYLPKHKSVARSGVIYEALVSEGRTEGVDVIDLHGKSIRVQTESLYVPYKRNHALQKRVVSFLTLT